jgi:hypothetical protein
MNVALPYMASDGVACTSPPDTDYNCIAWAAGDHQNWWEPWPLPDPDYYWPAGAPRQYTLLAYQRAFETVGFQPCANGTLEVGFEKIALYVLNGVPKHAARQLLDGRWTSKLGKFIDVRHGSPHGAEGPLYGTVALYMRRPRPTTTPTPLPCPVT